jgi:hypothetical protein
MVNAPESLKTAATQSEPASEPATHEQGNADSPTRMICDLAEANDIDHCYPYSETWTRPEDMKQDEFDKYRMQMNSLVNLQLLPFSDNRSKKHTPFDIWFAGLEVDEQTKIRQNNLIPTGHPVPSKEFGAVQKAFALFYIARRKLLLKRLQEVFACDLNCRTVENIDSTKTKP